MVGFYDLAVHAEMFQALGCTPIVNLFEELAEPIRLNHTQAEYRVIPDQHQQADRSLFNRFGRVHVDL